MFCSDAFETGMCRPNGTDSGHSLTDRFDLVATVPEDKRTHKIKKDCVKIPVQGKKFITTTIAIFSAKSVDNFSGNFWGTQGQL